MADDITALSLKELSDALASNQISSVEITEAYLARIEAHSELNCFIDVCADHARAHAKRADEARRAGASSPLLGIPVGVKDIINVKGLRTTCASKMLEHFFAPYDATVSARLYASGAFTIGKTNMDEFAMGSSNETSHFGPVRNPWDQTRVPGGSSGGSAAAVAASLCPVALGTDTGGSIRQPASLTGVVGLKPTYGRVSRYGVVAYASSLDQVGVFARNVHDCAVLTGVISGHDAADATSAKLDPIAWKAGDRSIKGLRIGIPKEYFVSGLSSEVSDALRESVRVLEGLGAIPVEISLPHTEAAVSVYYVIAPAEASSNLARYDGVRYGYRASDAASLSDLYRRTRSEGFGREVKRRIVIGTYVLSSGYYDAYYLRAQKVRSLITDDFQQAFERECDVILAPTAPTTAFKLGEKTSDPLEMYLNDIFTIPVNLAGLPGMSVPCGFDSQGLPIGLQLIGRMWDESSLLTVAAAYESATQWHMRKPPLS
jgi:aspartyl-tRNA(Asn)/glutamyl-tRNA(Gln) amidotransferase subunit A